VLAYIREHEGDVLLVVNNLSAQAQAVRLDLSKFAGRVPVELLGQTDFLPIDDTPYALTLSPYSFFWFALRPVKQTATLDPEELAALTRQWAEEDDAILADPDKVGALIAGLPHGWFTGQRWFRSKAREITAVELVDHAVVEPEHGPRILLPTVRVRYSEGEHDLYLLPFTLRPPLEVEDPQAVVCIPMEGREVELYEALVDRFSARALLGAMVDEKRLTTTHGELVGHRTAALSEEVDPSLPVRRVSAEQSNTSIIYGDQYILKLFRKLEAGINPDLEISRFLTESTDFRAFPALAGWIDYTGAEGAGSMAGLFEFVPNGGDAWSYTLKSLKRFFVSASRNVADPQSVSGQEALRRMGGDYFTVAERLGEMTARMHLALASAGPENPDFMPEPIGEEAVRQAIEGVQRHVGTVMNDVARRIDAIPGAFPPSILNELAEVVRDVANLRVLVEDLDILHKSGSKQSRVHGDYHLGQVLQGKNAGEGKEWVVLDFEGEPARPLAERRAKLSPLKDVAGMLRSFDYALRSAVAQERVTDITARHALEGWANAWLQAVRESFVGSYRAAIAGSALAPDDPGDFERVLAVFELEKAVYELGYEMNNRPDWLWIPVQGIRAITERA
jgi:maltose alpha-D-glucosyltransferase / alpha-amylase